MTRPKLLLADDSVTIRKVVELTFADEGIDVSTASDAQTAMQRFVEMQPDIVLVDVGLDGTSGYQICEMIKADDATKHIPVMLLVGSFEPFDGDEAHRVGADAFMTKPFNSIRDLVNRVTTLLSPDKSANDPLASEFIAVEPSPSLPEDDDIDDLYRSSFAVTAEVQEFDTVEKYESLDDLLGDAGMDDDMIEANQVSARNAEMSPGIDQNDSVKEFDWSPDAVVADGVQADDHLPSLQEKELDPKDWLEDDIPATVNRSGEEPENPVHELDDADTATYDAIDFSNSPAVVPVLLSSAELADDEEVELLDIFDDRNRVSGDDPAIHETVPYAAGELPAGLIDESQTNKLSEDVIDDIVRRVVHKLSDVVVRDIARVEVPRIAEKLIREALEQEPKD